MRKILIAVDETKGTRNSFPVSTEVCSCLRPASIVLTYVEQFEGKSLMTEMLGDAELSTLKETLEGTEYQQALDKKAKEILDYYKKVLEEKGLSGVKAVIRKGHPAEEILKAASEENADMIIIGSRGKRSSHLFMGSVSREVANNAEVPVLLVK